MLPIYDYLLDIIKDHLEKSGIHADIDHYIERAWHCNRYIMVIPQGWDSEMHYEYINGYWELHFEHGSESSEVEMLRKNLIKKFADSGSFAWHPWNNRQKGLLRLETMVEDPESFKDLFTVIHDATSRYLNSAPAFQDNSVFPASRLSPGEEKAEYPGDGAPADSQITRLSFETVESLPTTAPGFQVPPVPADENFSPGGEAKAAYLKPSAPIIQPISQLAFDRFEIPPYQRPYKWTVANVNQLINDILQFKNSNEYRLGTLVLYAENSQKAGATLNLVDGQQRIITLALLLYLLMNDGKYRDRFKDDFRTSLSAFLEKKQFHNYISRTNMLANLQAIRQRLHEFDEETVKFLLENCKFVIIELHDLSEAFQFFDSQNARGKELVPHDLLKAFHLRAITDRDEQDRENIKIWENSPTDTLEFLFLMLFRVKSWIKAREGRYFTSRDIGEFKGLDARNDNLPYQKIYTIAQCYAALYNQDIARRLDRNKLEFPYQIDQVLINGSHFFDLVTFYQKMLEELKEKQNEANPAVMAAVKSFKAGQGNKYTKFLFDAACLFYYDKFGMEGFARVMEKIFAWAYGRRLTSYAIKLATIDNLSRGVEGESFFAMLHNAIRPGDVLNWSVPIIDKTKIRDNQIKDDTAKKLLEDLHYAQ